LDIQVFIDSDGADAIQVEGLPDELQANAWTYCPSMAYSVTTSPNGEGQDIQRRTQVWPVEKEEK